MNGMDDKREREQVEWVFGLTGGELEDKPWGAERYWYDGVPSYAEREHREAGEYRTIVADLLLSCSGPEEMPADPEDEDARPWKRIATYHSSGETECPGRHEDEGSLVRADQAPPHTPEHLASLRDQAKRAREGRWWGAGRFLSRADLLRRTCYLCDAAVGENHEYIYLGDGWAEVVYFRPEEPEPEE